LYFICFSDIGTRNAFKPTEQKIMARILEKYINIVYTGESLMSILKKSLIVAGLFAAGASVQAQQVSANIGVTSDYIWRGVSQSSEAASVSGGVDYAHESGFYAGTWVGSLGDEGSGFSGSEVDLYLGYGGQVGEVGYDVGYIYYNYPTAEGDFGEIYGSYSWGIWSGGFAYTTNGGNVDGDDNVLFDSGDLYLHGGIGINLSETWTFSATSGIYLFDADGDVQTFVDENDVVQMQEIDVDYAFIQLDFGKSTDLGDFTISIVGTDVDSDNTNFGNGDEEIKAVVSWGIGF